MHIASWSTVYKEYKKMDIFELLINQNFPVNLLGVNT